MLVLPSTPPPHHSPPAAMKHYASAARRAACTHTRTTRQFGNEMRCTHCGKLGNQGWVYRCTQDSDGQIPVDEIGMSTLDREEFIDLADLKGWTLPGLVPPQVERVFNQEEDIHTIDLLKPWMKKAIDSGQYTSKQIDTLISQRLDVRKQIKADEACVVSAEKTIVMGFKSEIKRLYDRLRPTNQNDQTLNLDGQEESSSNEWNPSESDENVLEARLNAHRRASLCDYRCCPTCRPILRERSWMPLDSIVTNVDQPGDPQDIDMHLRRPALVDVLLGTDIYRWSNYHAGWSLYHEQSTDSERSENSQEDGSTMEGNTHRLTLNGWPLLHYDPADSLNTTSSSSLSSTGNDQDRDSNDDERMEALSVPRPQSRIGQTWSPGIGVSDMSTRMTHSGQHDSIAQVLGLPVPNLSSAMSNVSIHDHPGAEIHVPDGVALTEEAVDSGLADIITQV